MTQCTQSSFEFKAHYSREVVARFDGGAISSDGGSLLLRETDQRLNLLGDSHAVFWTGDSRTALNTPSWRWLRSGCTGSLWAMKI